MAKPNPNKVNQYTAPDPRQSLFLANYLDPKSATFGNAKQSGIKAGYGEKYSEVILHKDSDWLSNSVKDNDLVQRAEKALLEALNYSTMSEDGKVDSGVGRLKLDATKLVLKGLAKDRFSERLEQTGANGKDLMPAEISAEDKAKLLLLLQ